MKYGLISIILSLACVTTNVNAETVTSAKEMSFATIRHALREAPSQKELQKKLKEFSKKSYESKTSRDGILESELEGTKGVGDNKESRYSVSLMRGFVFGRSLDAWRQSYDAEAESRKLEAISSLNQQLIEFGETYASLLFIQRQRTAADKALERLKPLVAIAERGRATGSAASVAILKWRLMEKRIKAEQQNATASFRAMIMAINETLRTNFDDKIHSAKLVALSHPHDHKDIDFKDLPSVAALGKKQQSLNLKAKALDSRTEFAAGIGMERDEKDKLNSVMLKLSIPLGQGSVLANEVAEARAELKTVESEEQRLIEQLRHRERILHGYMESKLANVQSLVTLRDEFETILTTILKGLNQGLAEFPEAIEAIEKLYETELALAQAQRELDEVLVEIAVLTEEKI